MLHQYAHFTTSTSRRIIPAMFASIKRGPPDPMNELKRRADGDVSADKVDLGVGIYRNEDRVCHQLECVRQAKVQLAKDDPGHDVSLISGSDFAAVTLTWPSTISTR